MRAYWLFFLVILLALGPQVQAQAPQRKAARKEALAQSKKRKAARKKRRRELKTSNTYYQDNTTARRKGKKKRLLQVYRRDPARVLYGNRCVTELTQKMGFEYVIITPEAAGEERYVTTFAQNVSSGFLLTFRHGPFWQRKVRRRIRNCRESSGDFVGYAPASLPAPTPRY